MIKQCFICDKKYYNSGSQTLCNDCLYIEDKPSLETRKFICIICKQVFFPKTKESTICKVCQEPEKYAN